MLKHLGPGVYPTFPVVEVEKAIEQFVEGLADDQMHYPLQLQKLPKLDRCFILVHNMEQCYRQESQGPVTILLTPHGKGKSILFQVQFTLQMP